MLEELCPAVLDILDDYKDTILYYRTHVYPEIIEEYGTTAETVLGSLEDDIKMWFEENIE